MVNNWTVDTVCENIIPIVTNSGNCYILMMSIRRIRDSDDGVHVRHEETI